MILSSWLLPDTIKYFDFYFIFLLYYTIQIFGKQITKRKKNDEQSNIYESRWY